MKKRIQVLKISSFIYTKVGKCLFFLEWEDIKFNPFIPPWIFKTCSERETEVSGDERMHCLLDWEPLVDPDQGSSWAAQMLGLAPASASSRWAQISKWINLRHSLLVLIPITPLLPVHHVLPSERLLSFYAVRTSPGEVTNSDNRATEEHTI